MKKTIPPEQDKKVFERIKEIRRYLHTIPEPGFAEHKTSAYVAQILQELQIKHTAVAQTGIVAEIGPPETPCVAIRADIDGLPVTEATNLAYSSKHPGMMHACGHDGHIAMLLGAAMILKDRHLSGRVRFIFQPAEETDGGAQAIIEQGGLEGVFAIFGGHIDITLDAGMIAVQEGLICAYTDTFRIIVRGSGGHGAKPHETTDTIVAACALVNNLQTLISRETNPVRPAVLTIGKITGGSAPNIIASETIIEGTVRTTDEGTRTHILDGLQRMTKGMCHSFRISCDLKQLPGYPPIINDAAAAEIAFKAASEVSGEKNILPIPSPSMGGEDFSYYLQHVPGCFVRFGAGGKNQPPVAAHSPYYDFDEAVLQTGALFFSGVCLHALNDIDRLQQT